MLFQIFPELETPRLKLRRLKESDINAYRMYVQDADIQAQFKFLFTEETLMMRLKQLVERYDSENKPLIWAVEQKENLEMMGIISIFSYHSLDQNCALSYGLISSYRGQGFITEACNHLISYLFEHTNMHRIEIAHREGNEASKRVIEKIGAVYEGCARESQKYDDKMVDRHVYSILKKERTIQK